MTDLATTETVITVTSVKGATWSIEGKKFVSRKPKGFTTGHDDSLACSHRDLSVCDECEATYANIVNVFSTCYWVRDYAEWRALVAELCAIDLEYA